MSRAVMVATVALVLGFRTSTNLAAAYGVAVSATMVITTVLAYFVSRDLLGWSRLAKVRGQANGIGLVFFGLHCLLVGILILRSTFPPRIVGALMVFAGLGWLTFLSPPLARSLSPYIMIPGGLGETSLTLWLLVMGVNVQRWKEQASASGTNAPS